MKLKQLSMISWQMILRRIHKIHKTWRFVPFCNILKYDEWYDNYCLYRRLWWRREVVAWCGATESSPRWTPGLNEFETSLAKYFNWTQPRRHVAKSLNVRSRHVFVHTCIRVYVDTCIRAYVYTCIHVYVYTGEMCSHVTASIISVYQYY